MESASLRVASGFQRDHLDCTEAPRSPPRHRSASRPLIPNLPELQFAGSP